MGVRCADRIAWSASPQSIAGGHAESTEYDWSGNGLRLRAEDGDRHSMLQTCGMAHWSAQSSIFSCLGRLNSKCMLKFSGPELYFLVTMGIQSHYFIRIPDTTD